MQKQQFDEIQKSEHYNSHPSGVECIEIIRHENLNCGNAIKYIWRRGEKDDTLEGMIKDLKKAAYYVNDEIKRLEKIRESNQKSENSGSVNTERKEECGDSGKCGNSSERRADKASYRYSRSGD